LADDPAQLYYTSGTTGLAKGIVHAHRYILGHEEFVYCHDVQDGELFPVGEETAQKIDVVTHTYSKTKYVASFAGFAPVNNPAISVTVIIDSPSAGGSYYGAAVSAPVFRDVAQQVLEYLGVPHDTEVKQGSMLAVGKDLDEAPPEHTGDLTEYFADVNDLPADDPLRAPPVPKQQEVAASSQRGGAAAQPEKLMVATKESKELLAPDKAQTAPLVAPPTPAPAGAKGSVIVASGQQVAVPSFVGLAMRKVVEQAGQLGLGVQVIGNGIAREQAPAAGSMVPVGTQVIVRCVR